MKRRLPPADVDALVDQLRDRLDDRLRSVVSYSPDSRNIHYVRADLAEATADSRLVRVNQLYHAERLNAEPTADDRGFGPLFASTFYFRESVVYHVVEPSGVVYGFSVDPSDRTHPRALLDGAVGALYHERPTYFDVETLSP